MPSMLSATMAFKSERELRECGHKKKYDSRKEARIARDKYERRFGGKMKTYRCSFCAQFHIGHKLRGVTKHE